MDDAHVANAGEGHVKRAGNGSGGEGQNVDLAAHPLQGLLVGDAEALLLVNDDEAEVLEADVFLEETVGADDNVNGALLEAGGRLPAALGWCGNG